jgi:hypothetical protein
MQKQSAPLNNKIFYTQLAFADQKYDKAQQRKWLMNFYSNVENRLRKHENNIKHNI